MRFIRSNGFLSMIFVIITILTLATTSQAATKMGQIAIFNEMVGWTTVAVAQAATNIIVDKLKLTKDIEVLNDANIGAFAEKNTKDGDMDIIITFGYFPVSLYKPGNAEADNSVGEKFLEGGNMFMNTADYIFYVSSAVNGDAALKNMTDSTFDLWTDGNKCSPTDDGKKLTPSLPASYDAVRCFKGSQILATKDWEVEMAFGSNGADYYDPVVIRNKDYDGRVGIFFQQSNDALPRGPIVVEMLDNWLSKVVKGQAVDSKEKLPTVWGEIKR